MALDRKEKIWNPETKHTRQVHAITGEHWVNVYDPEVLHRSGSFKPGDKVGKVKKGLTIKAKASRPGCKGTLPAVEVKLDTGHQFICSKDHQVKLVDGSFRLASELNPNTQLSADPTHMTGIYRRKEPPKVVSVTPVEDRECWAFTVDDYNEYYHQGTIHHDETR